MKKLLFVPVLFAAVCTGCREKVAEAFRLADAVVVTAKCAGERERGALASAAADLTNVIFHVTRRCAPICEEGAEPKGAAVRIYLGPTEAARVAGIDGEGLRNGDWRVKTVPGKAFLFGKTAWGAQCAVVEFAERYCDHWVVSVDAVDVYRINPDLTVPVADVTVRPAIYSRELYHGMFNGIRNPKTVAAWNRYGRMLRTGMPSSIEGRYRLSHAVRGADGKTTLCHSQFSYLHPEKYFKDHPEYYSMDENGKRCGTANFDGQLCFTNPDTYRLVLESLERFVAEDRAKNPSNPPCVYDFTQLDNCSRLCLCPDCRKVIAKYNRTPDGHAEGGDAGLQLEFVNRLARDIRKKYDGVYIRTFAYVTSERAPKPGMIAVEPNVIIWWCDLYSTCDHTQPLTKAGHYNGQHARNLREWAALTSNLQIWDYKLPSTAWDYALMGGIPEVCATAMQEDARFYAKCGVPCYFIEQYPGQPFYDLECFLNAHLLVDPESDVDRLIRTFCRGYGKAADDMYAAIGFLRHELESRPAATPGDWHVRNLPWVDRATFERLQGMVEAAYAKEADSEIRPRIARVLAACWKTLIGIYGKDPSAADALKGAIAAYRTYGEEVARTAFMEPARRKECLEQVATDIELLTLKFNDLPAELKGVPADELVCVDYHFRRDGKKVEDKASERGFSVKAVGYKGGPLVCGVYDEQSKDSYGFRIAPDAQPKDGLFHWAKLGRCHNGHNSIFWFPGTWYSSFKLKDKYIQADGLAVDPNWYEVWASFRRTESEAFIDRLVFRRIAPPAKK